MEINSFVFHLIVCITPGFISYIVFKHLKTSGKSDYIQKDWVNILLILIFTIIDFVFIEAFYYFYEYFHYLLHYSILNKIFNINLNLNFFDFITLFFVAFIIGVASAYLYNKKILFRIAKLLNITKSYGEEDVWTMTVGDESLEWCYIRDHKFEKIYFGHIEKYSDTNTDREITITQVIVYDNITGDELYYVPRLYLCRDKYELTIEQALTKGEEDVYTATTTKTINRRDGKERRNKSSTHGTKTNTSTTTTRTKKIKK